MVDGQGDRLIRRDLRAGRRILGGHGPVARLPHGLLAVDIRVTRRLGEPGLLEGLGRDVTLHADDVGNRDEGLGRGGPRGRGALRGGPVAPGEHRGQGEDQGDEASAGGQHPAARTQRGGLRRGGTEAGRARHDRHDGILKGVGSVQNLLRYTRPQRGDNPACVFATIRLSTAPRPGEHHGPGTARSAVGANAHRPPGG